MPVEQRRIIAGSSTAVAHPEAAMQSVKRYLCQSVADTLRKKMVFIEGPRLVDETTLARSFPRREERAEVLPVRHRQT